MKLPLIRENGICQLVNLTDNILYLQTNKSGKIRLYSEAHKYKPVQGVDEWSDFLSAAGFVRVDRGTIVNMSKVVELDPVLRVLEIRTETGRQLTIPVSESALSRLQAELEKRLQL